ncbi:MAG: molybdopterin molybdotransferase MoeA [Pseudomonadota bacterium]
MGGLLPLEQAQAQLLALAPEMPAEKVAVDHALGRVLAEDVQARRTQPPADLSAMDGYAIGGEDGPWQLVGESRAGAPFPGILSRGEATRISTGAHMPEGSDRVLIQENAERDGDQISTPHPLPERHRHVRLAGFDFNVGDLLLDRGTHVGAAQIALAIAAGHAQIGVTRKPRIAILDSGDELAANPENCAPDQIPASNGAMIAAMIAPLIGDAERLGPVADDPAQLAKALERAENCDILITSGGASVGDHDLVRPALEQWGAQIAFWKAAIRPGKPLMVAQRGKQVVLGLPGNPVSSFVTCFLFAMPLIRATLGLRDPVARPVPAELTQELPATSHRRAFLRGVAKDGKVRLAPSQDSSALLSLAQANCLIDRAPHSPCAAIGDQVQVYPLPNG